MADYQNLFTQVQVNGTIEMGIPIDRPIDTAEMVGKTLH
jgi:hypothetical protein